MSPIRARHIYGKKKRTVGGVNYYLGRAGRGEADAEEIQGPYTGTHGRNRRARDRTRVQRDEHAGLEEGTSYGDPLRLPRGRGLDRKASSRVPRRYIPRFCGRPADPSVSFDRLFFSLRSVRT